MISYARRCVGALAAVILCLEPGASTAQSGSGGTTGDAAAIRNALESGAYEDAERLAARWSSSTESVFGKETSETAFAADLLVEALRLNGKASSHSTVTLAEWVASQKARLFGTDSLEFAVSLHGLGAVFTDRGEFAKAVTEHQRALVIRRGALPAGDPRLADSFDLLSLPLIWLDRFADAEMAIGAAARIRESNAESAPLAQAHTLYLQALLRRGQGNYAEATSLINKALGIRRRLTPRHPELIVMLQLSGQLSFALGDARKAQQTLTEALRLAEETVGPAHPIVAPVLHRLAYVAQEFGDLTLKRKLLDQTIEILPTSTAPCYAAELPAALNDLGTLMDYLGDFREAGRYFDEALARFKQCLGSTHSITTTIMHNQAILSADMGDLPMAERLQRQAVDAWSAKLGPDHPYVARGITALADIAVERKETVKAHTLYTRALRIRLRAFGNDHPDVASTLVSLARVDAANGKLTQALTNVSHAIDIYQRGVASQEPDHLARALELKGQLQLKQGDFADARATFADAVDRRMQMFGARHPLVAASQVDLAIADFALGMNDVATDGALNAERTGRDHLRFTIRYLPERQGLLYAAKRPRGLDLALSLVAAGPFPEVPLVLDSVVQSRGVILDELAARAGSTSSLDPQIMALSVRVGQARERFANLMLRSFKGEEQVPPNLLDEARREKEDAERALVEGSASARAERARASAGLEDVRQALPTNSALISYVRYDRTTFTRSNGTKLSHITPSYMALVMSVRTVAAIPLGPAADVDALVGKWHGEILEGANLSTPTPATGQPYRAAGAALRHRIWDPLAPHLAGIDRVFIVPDGSLNLVAFDALPTSRNKYLVETGPIVHYLSAERDLVALRETSPLGKGLLAIGGAAFDAAPSNGATTAAGLSTARSGCSSLQLLQFDPLPGTQLEVGDVSRLWNAADEFVAQGRAIVLTGREAGKRQFKEMASGRRILHIATHGFFLGNGCGPISPPATRSVGGLAIRPDRRLSTEMAGNPLVMSGLAFAGANGRQQRKTSGDDGILTAEEVTGLNLEGVEWAVLSACDTGLGEVKAGEGVLGLRRAFQIAGARTVIMSLWAVDDQAARTWMRTLYRVRLQRHLNTADAMHDASLTVLRDRRTRGQNTHPFYWAGFVAAGDWR
jgi:CHAT domain-containing protein